MYRSKDIQIKAGVTRMQLIRWVEVGAIEPFKDVRQRGKSRIFSYQNLVEAMICKELNRFRVETYTMKRVLNMMRDRRDLDLSSYWDELDSEKIDLEDTYLRISEPANAPVKHSSNSTDSFADANITVGWGTKDQLSKDMGNYVTSIIINISNLLRKANDK